jgi:AcrR family transcriptional regulator
MRASTRQTILDAAQTVFEKGIARARMEDIAAEAGVAVGTLYNHFADRRSLLDALVDARQAEFREAMDAVVSGASGEPFARRLERYFQAALGLLERHHAFLSAAWEDEAARSRDFSKRSALRELRSHAETLVREALEAGTLRADGADLYPSMIVGILSGAAGAVARGEKRQPIEQLSTRLASCFLNGAAER